MRLERRYRVRHAYIPLETIIVHPQMRLAINEKGIEELANNILHHGLIHPLCVADTQEGYILISGHRRLRAMQLLSQQGQGMKEIPVAIFENIGPCEMALLQASENIHEQVPPHEAARFYEATWRLLKLSDSGFTFSDFARAVGRSEETLRNALRFAFLPEKIQNFVREGSLPYGGALEIARIQGIANDTELEQWAIRAIISKTKVSEIKASVDRYLTDLGKGQLSLLEIFEESVQKELEKTSRRILIDRGTTKAFWDAISYLKRLLDLFSTGKLQKEDLPWLRQNPRKAFHELLSFEKRLLEYMGTVLPKEEMENAMKIIRQCEQISKEPAM